MGEDSPSAKVVVEVGVRAEVGPFGVRSRQEGLIFAPYSLLSMLLIFERSTGEGMKQCPGAK